MSTPQPAARKRLPVKPSEENLRKQAERRAKQDAIPLAEAQHALACEYGARNWPELMHVVEVMNRGADQLTNVKREIELLPKAVRARNVAEVRAILATGQFTQHDLDAALAHAAWYGGDAPDVIRDRKELFDLLLDHGADPDGQYGSAYGPIVLGCGECLSADGLQWLIDAGCNVTFGPVETKYGESFPLATWLGTYERGRNDAKHRGIEMLLKHGAHVPADLHPAVLAIHRGDVDVLARQIDTEPSLPRRRFRTMPYGSGNMRLDGATLLHVAVEYGEVDCVDLLLDRWMEPNAQADIINGIGGQTPVFHAIATNQGKNLYTLEHLVRRLGYAIEGHRNRATFRVYGTVYDTPMNPIEYAERVSGEDTPAWRRATPRDLELVRSFIWPGSKRKVPEDKTPVERLQEACRAGDFDAVKQLIEAGEVPKEKLNLGIEGCAMTKREDIARYLIDRSADINADYIDNYGPVLLGFCESLDDEAVEFLLKLGARADWQRRPSSKYPDHSTPLRMTCETYVRGRNIAKHRLIDLLLAAGATPELEFPEAVMAIHRGDAKRLQELIDADRTLVRKDKQFIASFDFADEPRRAPGTLLHIAVEHNEIACIDTILSNYRSWDDSDINARAEIVDGLGGHTPLFLAAHSWMGVGYPTLQYIIQRVGQYIDTGVVAKIRKDAKPVDQTVMDYAGERERKVLEPLDRKTQIRRAIEANDVATFVRMLDEHPDLVTPGLWPTVIHKAKSVEMTRILLDRGVDPSACPAPRKPLHLATYYSLADIVELLIEHGADATFLNPLGERPMDLVDAYEPRPIGDEQSLRTREALIRAGAIYDIHTAVRTGDVNLVRPLLDADPSLVHTPQPWNPLFTAARAGRLEVAKLLLERGANVNGSNDKGNTPLWFACQSSAPAADRIEIAKLLLNAGADVNRRCEDGTTAMHFAAWRGPAAMVKLLLDHGGRQWLGDDKGKTVMDHARESSVNPDKEATVRLLTEIDFGDEHFAQAVAMIDAGDVEGLRRLLAAHPHVVTMRVTGDSAITRGYFTQPTLLHFVANNPNRPAPMSPRILEITQAILDAGAEVDAATPNEMGGTTLALVASSEPAKQANMQVPLIELLVRNGAKPDHGLLAAIVHRYTDAVEAMLRLGARHTLASAAGMGDSDAVRQFLKDKPSDADKLRAMHVAAVNGKVGPVDTLLDAGVDINARLLRPFEPTALHEAAWHNHRRLVDRLLQRGADPTIQDTQYNGTPAGWAHHAGHTELAQHLQEAIPMVQAIAAMRRGDVEELIRMLKEQPSLTSTRLNGRTLLHILCDWPANMPRSSDSARALVAAGIDVNVPLHQDTDHLSREWAHNATPVHWAASSNDATELCQTLIDLGADIDATTANDGTTPLVNAMHFNITGAVRVLLRAGARTSVIIAAGLGDLAMVKSYFNPDGSLKPGAGDPPFKHTDVRRILSQAVNFAAMYGHDAVIEFLAARGAPLSDVDTFVRAFATPLHRAVNRDHLSTVKLLLKLGADPTVKDPQFGGDALDWAKHNGKHEAAKLLEALEEITG